MRLIPQKFFVLILPCLLTGCFASPNHHAWEVSPKDAPALQDALQWRQLSINEYVRVPDSQWQDAMTLLQIHASVKLDSEMLSRFAPNGVLRVSEPSQAYLVRGASFLDPPFFTIVRFDQSTDILLVQQFSWSEFAFFEEISKPNAFVVVLPRPPERVYVQAVLGGDGIFRGGYGDITDTR